MKKGEKELPNYFELLNQQDKESYYTLQKNLSSSECRNCRNKRLDNFANMLEVIKQFSMRNDEDDWKRLLVCGVCWISDGIAINTHQLSILLGKCKSSVNGSLQRLEYVPFPCSAAASTELIDQIPKIKENYGELRQWTLRKKVIMTPQPNVNYTKPITQPTFNTPQPLPPKQNIIPFYDELPPLPEANQQKPNSPKSPKQANDEADFFDDPFMCPIDGWSFSKDSDNESSMNNPFSFFL